MVIDTATSLTFDIIGMREDLRNLIYNISPTDTPFSGNIPKTSSARNTSHEWLTDVLAAADGTGSLEGDSFVGDSLGAATRLVNTCMILKKQIEISGTLVDGVTLAGRNNEYAYQATKARKAIKRNLETAMTGNAAPNNVANSNSTTARVMRPLTGWYSTNVANVGAGGGNGTATAARADGTQAAMTLTTLRALVQSVWTRGGTPDMIMCGGFNKGVISNFGGPTGTIRTQDADERTLYTRISVLDTDFGELSVVPNRFSRTRDVHVLTTDLWKMATSRPLKLEDLAKTGDAYRGHLFWEGTLEASNQAGSGLLADATTS